MSDRYYPQTYKRSDGVIEKHYIWASKIKTAKHKAANGEKLTVKNIYFAPEVNAPQYKSTMTPQQIRKDRLHRSTEHFKKEIFPTLKKGSHEQKHFAKKHALKY